MLVKTNHADVAWTKLRASATAGEAVAVTCEPPSRRSLKIKNVDSGPLFSGKSTLIPGFRDLGSCSYSLRKYANSAARSSGRGARSKFTPSVEAIGGTTPGGAFTFTRLKNSM